MDPKIDNFDSQANLIDQIDYLLSNGIYTFKIIAPLSNVRIRAPVFESYKKIGIYFDTEFTETAMETWTLLNQ